MGRKEVKFNHHKFDLNTRCWFEPAASVCCLLPPSALRFCCDSRDAGLLLLLLLHRYQFCAVQQHTLLIFAGACIFLGKNLPIFFPRRCCFIYFITSRDSRKQSRNCLYKYHSPDRLPAVQKFGLFPTLAVLYKLSKGEELKHKRSEIKRLNTCPESFRQYVNIHFGN